jgi:hypothetical protein
LVELDEHNVLLARRAAQDAGLDGVQIVGGDASLTDAYVGAVPADLVLVCGVFGNISAQDIQHTITTLPQLCAADATVIWDKELQLSNVSSPCSTTAPRCTISYGGAAAVNRLQQRTAAGKLTNPGSPQPQ